MTNVPERELFELLGDQEEITVATAESCTGGNVAGRITRIAGSSAYMMGGIVSYSNDVKANLLGVSREVLENPGAVSEECAMQMAEGARRALGHSRAAARARARLDGSTRSDRARRVAARLARHRLV